MHTYVKTWQEFRYFTALETVHFHLKFTNSHCRFLITVGPATS